MQLFFQIQNLQLLIFCVHDQDFVANLDYIVLCFFCNIIKVNHSCIVSIYLVTIFSYIQLHLVSSFLHTRSLLVPYTYVSIESIYCILLSQLAINAIFIASSFKTLCFLLLNLCYDFNTSLLIFVNTLCFSLRVSTSSSFFL